MVREDFLVSDEWNPKGYYEDRMAKGFTKKLAEKKPGMTPEYYAERMETWLSQGEDVAWGFKVPQLCYAGPEAISALRPRAIIACLRERVQTGRSIARWRQSKWKTTEEGGLLKHDRRMVGLLKLLHGWTVLWLDFSEPRDEGELETMIEVHLYAVDLIESAKQTLEPAEAK